MTYKVLAKAMPSPAKFSLQYRELPTGTLRSDLKVYLSVNIKEPKEGHCSKSFTNVIFAL